MTTLHRGRIRAPFSIALAALLASTAVPALAQDAPPADPAADQAEPEAVIVVTGQREAERRAIDKKRAADTIQDSVAANDVGKLPDQNVAEAIRRIPGISIANDQGRGPLRHHPRRRSQPRQRHAQRPDRRRARARGPPGQARRHPLVADRLGRRGQVAHPGPRRQRDRRPGRHQHALGVRSPGHLRLCQGRDRDQQHERADAVGSRRHDRHAAGQRRRRRPSRATARAARSNRRTSRDRPTGAPPASPTISASATTTSPASAMARSPTSTGARATASSSMRARSIRHSRTMRLATSSASSWADTARAPAM